MIEQNKTEIDSVSDHYYEFKSLLTRINTTQIGISDFNSQAAEHLGVINDVENRSYVSFYFRQRIIPEWDRERFSDYFRQLHYYRIENNEFGFVGRIPQISIMRKLVHVKAMPVKHGRAIAYFFQPDYEDGPNAILSSPRSAITTPTLPDMTLYRSPI